MKKILFRIVGVVAVAILVGNCVGCKEQSPEKGNTNGIEVETIEVKTIEVETIEVENVD